MVAEPQRIFRLHLSHVFGLRSLSDFILVGEAWPSQQEFVERYIDFTLVYATPWKQVTWLRVLHTETTQIVERLGATELILPPAPVEQCVHPHLGCTCSGREYFVPAIPKSALLGVVWTPPVPKKPHPISLHSRSAGPGQIRSFLRSSIYFGRVLLPVYADLQFRLALQLLPVLSQFWFLGASIPGVQYFVQSGCQAVETERHLFF
uniref:Uncharacterized protein n=1 Tax=Peronospora matthiolae TaxID=2874970 RepID=A0AAV1UDD4_9STRA